MICEKDGNLIHSHQRRHYRSAEHFQEQLRGPLSVTLFGSDNPHPEWDVNISPPTVAETTKKLQLLKRNKASGLNQLSPTLFKDGGQVAYLSSNFPLLSRM